MESKFYTSIDRIGNRILVREIIDGVERRKEVQYEPKLFVKSNKKGPYVSLYEDNVKEVDFESIGSANDFIKKYNGMDGFEVFGQQNWILQYLFYYDLKNPVFSDVSVSSIDIETRVPESGFPNPIDTTAEITLITILTKNGAVTFGSKPYTGTDTDYRYCVDEETLLKSFLNYWSENTPAILTGWNINKFDISYIVNRTLKILGQEWVNKLSPWRKVNIRVGDSGKDIFVDILGVQILDYLELMKKYTYGGRSSWALGSVAQEELGTTKLDHSEFKSFNEFQDKDWDKFVRYNIIDAKLVLQLDNKLKLIDLAMTIAYEAKINYQDVYSPVKTWDAILHNRLLERNIVIPQRKSGVSGMERSIAGGFVKAPKPGFYKNCSTIDATSLYPSIMMMLNLSPETFVDKIDFDYQQYVSGLKPDHSGYSMAANGVRYRKDKLGIIPETVKHFFDSRKVAKKEMLTLEQEYEKTHDESLVPKIAALDNKQMAYKILANALFGAMANAGFRFASNDIAESITLTGQMFLKSIDAKLPKLISEKFDIPLKPYVIYTDTDSVFLHLDEILNKYAPKNISMKQRIKFLEKLTSEKIQPLVKDICDSIETDLNVYEKKISFKLEKAAESIILVAAKKYAAKVHSSEGVTFDKPKLMVTGLEMVRSSTPHWVREKLEETMNLVFDKNESELQDFILKVKNEFMKLSPEDVARPTGVNGLEERMGSGSLYPKGTPIHVRAAILYNHLIDKMKLQAIYPKIGEGDKMRYIYLKVPNTIHENVIGWPAEEKMLEEFNLKRFIDWDTQFDKTYLAAIEIVLNAIGWSATKVDNLDEFF